MPLDQLTEQQAKAAFLSLPTSLEQFVRLQKCVGGRGVHWGGLSWKQKLSLGRVGVEGGYVCVIDHAAGGLVEFGLCGLRKRQVDRIDPIVSSLWDAEPFFKIGWDVRPCDMPEFKRNQCLEHDMVFNHVWVLQKPTNISHILISVGIILVRY